MAGQVRAPDAPRADVRLAHAALLGQQYAGESACVSDDIYGLGALLYFVASGAQLVQLPNPFDIARRPLRILNPEIDPAVARVIERCLASNCGRRCRSLTEIDAALSSATGAPTTRCPAARGRRTETQARARCEEMARHLGDALSSAARVTEDRRSAWMIGPRDLDGFRGRDLGFGSAGTVLALAELVDAFGDASHRATLAEGVRWLQDAPRPEGARLPGLYVGEGGIAAALLRAGQILGEPTIVADAVSLSRGLATLPYGSPDIYNGTAGRLRLHLLVWDETRRAEDIEHARQAAEMLLQTADENDAGECWWRYPPGYAELSASAYLGYAHGAAGMADALLDLFDATGDERFAAAARAVARWLGRQAIPVLEDRRGLDWPVLEGGEPARGFWCHGAAGVGQFFLHAARSAAVSGALQMAERAALTVARGTRWAGPTQCHGLAGGIEFLLDLYQATGARGHLSDARDLGRLLEAFSVEQAGSLAWASDAPTKNSADYMVGFAGVAACLLRLADPDNQPRQLSRFGFRYRRPAQNMSR